MLNVIGVHADAQLAAVVRHGVGRVGEEVHEHLSQLACHAAHGRQARVELAQDLNLGALELVFAENERFFHDILGLHRARHVGGGARIGHEIARKVQDARGGFTDAAQALEVVLLIFVRGAPGSFALQVVRVSDDRGERIVQLVHDAGDDLPERGELLVLNHLCLQFADRAGRLFCARVESRATHCRRQHERGLRTDLSLERTQGLL